MVSARTTRPAAWHSARNARRLASAVSRREPRSAHRTDWTQTASSTAATTMAAGAIETLSAAAVFSAPMDPAGPQVVVAALSDSVGSAPIPANAARWEEQYSATTMGSPVMVL